MYDNGNGNFVVKYYNESGGGGRTTQTHFPVPSRIYKSLNHIQKEIQQKKKHIKSHNCALLRRQTYFKTDPSPSLSSYHHNIAGAQKPSSLTPHDTTSESESANDDGNDG